MWGTATFYRRPAAITVASREEVVGHLDWAEERCTIGGLMHGGALMTLADSLGAVAAFLHLPEGAGTATVSSSTSLLRGLREGRATGTATVINAGRRFITVRTDIVDDAGKPLTTTTQSKPSSPEACTPSPARVGVRGG